MSSKVAANDVILISLLELVRFKGGVKSSSSRLKKVQTIEACSWNTSQLGTGNENAVTMKNQKPSHYSNFITFKDVLHPESLYASTEPAPPGNGASEVVLIDEPHSSGGNKWNIVWAEATLLNDDSSDIGVGTETNNSPPPATPVAPTPVSPTLTVLDAPYHHSGLLESAIGLPLMIGAVSATFLTEILALLVYFTAVCLHCLAVQCKNTNCGVFFFIPRLLHLIFELTAEILMICDYILLLCSVLISESLAVSCWIINSILSCFRCGMQWHQYIRRVCHVTRWACRDFHQHWEPPRVLPFGHPHEERFGNTAPHTPSSLDASPSAPVVPEIVTDPYNVTKPEYPNNSDIKI